MQQIQIQQQFGQIGIKITPAKLNLAIKQPELDLSPKPADLALHTEYPEVIIDLRESFNTMGLQDIVSLEKTEAAEARKTVLSGIERRVADGEKMREPNGPSVAKIVSDSAPQMILKKELKLGLMPEAPPKISAKLGSIKGSYSPGNLNGNYTRGTITGDFAWGRVDVYMEREPSIDISV